MSPVSDRGRELSCDVGEGRPRFIINPRWTAYHHWSTFTTVLVVVSAFMTPLRYALVSEEDYAALVIDPAVARNLDAVTLDSIQRKEQHLRAL